jgi:hypothetical protein
VITLGFLELDHRLSEIQEDECKELYSRDVLLLAEALCALAEEVYKLRLNIKI